MAGSCTETAAVLQMVGGPKGSHEGAENSYKFPGATEKKKMYISGTKDRLV